MKSLNKTCARLYEVTMDYLKNNNIKKTVQWKRNFCVMIILITMSLFSNPLFSLNKSKVIGVVIDKDTGKSIAGASITLFRFFSSADRIMEDEMAETSTDAGGSFSFDVENPGQYFVRCEKKDYIPFPSALFYNYLQRDLVQGYAKVFDREEGQNKHMRIELEKGGSIDVSLSKKINSEISPISSWITVYLNKSPCKHFMSREKYVIGTFILESGGLRFSGLIPSEHYCMRFRAGNGYPDNLFKNITVKKNQTTMFHKVMELADHTGFEGTISINGKTPASGYVSAGSNFLLPDGSSVLCMYTLPENDGHYFCKSLTPGKYNVRVWACDSDGAKLSKSTTVDIKDHVLIRLDFSN